MRNKFPMISLVLLFPLLLGWGMARAADQQDVGGFKIMLSDGSSVKGAVSFVIALDTEYGQIKLPSSSVVSARFDAQQEWADIRLNGGELKMKYKPASSDLNATLAMGPLKIALTKVVSIENGSAEASSGVPPSQANVQQPPVASVPQQPPETASPPATVYQYPYQYAQPAPYYYDYPYYDYWPYYGLGYGYYGWPYIGLGFGWGWGHGFHGGFGRGFGGFHGGFGGRHR
jgi:hypothetical protein